MKVSPSTINALGWVGMVLILLAYVGGIFGILATKGLSYLFLNLIGSAFLVIETRVHRDHPPMILNIIWAIVALIGIMGVLLRLS